DDPERLHDMRVAIRRLRAMLALFADVLPIRFAAAAATLEWIARALGAVRDLDVQLAHLDAWRAEMDRDDAEGLTMVSDVLRRRRTTSCGSAVSGCGTRSRRTPTCTASPRGG